MSENVYHNIDQDQVCPVSGETRQEEQWNYFTHLIGLLLSVVGSGILLWSSLSSDFWNLISCCVYSFALIVLYSASTFYHRCEFVFRKKTWKIVDHSSIYLFIAGCYTPFTLGPLRSHNGWFLFFVVWGIALCGILFKLVAINRFKVFSLLSYLLMGWLIVFSLPTLMELLSPTAFAYMIFGGLAYTLGTLFYAWEALPFSHAIWHLFVLVGSFFHYCAILTLI